MIMAHKIIKSYRYKVMAGRKVFDSGVVFAEDAKTARMLVKDDVANQTDMRVVIQRSR